MNLSYNVKPKKTYKVRLSRDDASLTYCQVFAIVPKVMEGGVADYDGRTLPHIPIIDVDAMTDSSTSSDFANREPIKISSPRVSQGIITPEVPDIDSSITESESATRKISSIYIDTSRLVSSATISLDSHSETSTEMNEPQKSTSDESVEISTTSSATSGVSISETTETSTTSNFSFSSEPPGMRRIGKDKDKEIDTETEKTFDLGGNEGEQRHGRSVATTCCLLL